MTLSICLTGCSVQNKSSVAINHPSSTNQITGTSIENPTTSTNQSVPTESVTTSKSSSSSTDGNPIDYSQYIHKIWIDHSLMKSKNKGMSFYISNISDGKLVGKCTINGLHGFCKHYDSADEEVDYADLTGTIENGKADCHYFAISSKVQGSFELKFKSDNEIEVFFPEINETSQYAPYTINDVIALEGLIPNENQSFTVNLNSWGDVNFVSGEISNASIAYLTNKEGDIFYDFGFVLIDMGPNIKAVSFQDVNKDGLKDIIIITAGNNDSSKVKAEVIFQKADRSFYIDGKLNQEINNSSNNKDIKTITDYLSKKF